MPSNKMISDFSGKPATDAFYRAVDEHVMSLKTATGGLRSQVNYFINRKTLWMWAYETTGDGTLYLDVTPEHRQDDEHIHTITQVSLHRWNQNCRDQVAADGNEPVAADLDQLGHRILQPGTGGVRCAPSTVGPGLLPAAPALPVPAHPPGELEQAEAAAHLPLAQTRRPSNARNLGRTPGGHRVEHRRA